MNRHVERDRWSDGMKEEEEEKEKKMEEDGRVAGGVKIFHDVKLPSKNV